MHPLMEWETIDREQVQDIMAGQAAASAKTRRVGAGNTMQSAAQTAKIRIPNPHRLYRQRPYWLARPFANFWVCWRRIHQAADSSTTPINRADIAYEDTPFKTRPR